MQKKDLIELIEVIQTDSPGKKYAVDFLNKYEGELSKELVEMLIFFTGMLLNYEDLLTKAQAFENITAIRERYDEKIAELHQEIVSIGEQLSPTAVG